MNGTDSHFSQRRWLVTHLNVQQYALAQENDSVFDV
jgi:hypothetical protein